MNSASRAVAVKTEGLHHYTVSVASTEEAARWYSEKLGFKVLDGPLNRDVGKVCYMQAPGFLLEMFEVPNARPVPAYAAGPEPDTDLTVAGHKHFALAVPDVPQAVNDLEALDVKVLSFKDVYLEGVGRFLGAFITDNTGGLIELGEAKFSNRPVDLNKAPGRKSIIVDTIHHVAINVPNRDEAIEWYAEKLGFTVASTFEVAAIGLRSAFMQGPGFTMEIHSGKNASPVPQERRNPYTDLQTLGNKYFALAVKDIEQSINELNAAGIDVLSTEEAHGNYRVFINDNSGILIELFQL